MSQPQPTLPAESSTTLSQFAATVLSQLRISAWLPGASLVGGLYLLALIVAIQSEEDNTTGAVTFADVLSRLGNTDLTMILILVLATAIVTTSAQAFSFGVIRLLEGYWGFSIPTSPLRIAGQFVQHRQQQYFRIRLKRLRKKAIKSSARRMKLTEERRQALLAISFGGDVEVYREEILSEVESIDWEKYRPPTLARQIEAVQTRLKEFPTSETYHMPTRIGNILRTAEERYFKDERPIQLAVIRRYSSLPVAVRVQHDSARNQLDLYGLLVAASLVLGLAGAAAIHDEALRIGWLVASLAGGVINYRAMVQSTRYYTTVLGAVAEYDPAEPLPSTEASGTDERAEKGQ